MEEYNLRGLSTDKDALLNSITVNISDGDDGTYEGVSFDGSAGGTQGVIANVVISGNALVSITITSPGFDIFIGDQLIINGDFCDSSGEIIFVLQRDAFTAYSLSPSIVNQSWNNNIPTVLGLTTIAENTQKEFYDGELSGSTIIATTQSLLNDPSFNPLLNNVSGSRLNSYLMKVEYNNGIVTASNNPQILDRTAQRAAVPDSNYTAKKVILPRYEGSKVSSADYNFYTSASNNTEFVVGSTGSWVGDSSYGKTAAIDKNPIYFAHFNYSWDNPVIFGMGEYFVDQLIEVPFNDIKGTPIDPKVLKIEGNNSKLQEISSTFEVNRKLAAAFDSEQYEGVNYSSIKRTNLKILNPGSRYVLTSGNQISQTNTTVSYSYSRFNGQNPQFNTFEGINTSNDMLLATGSGHLLLSGSDSGLVYFTNSSSFSGNNIFMGLSGPYLSVLHTYNYCISNDILTGNTTPSPPEVGVSPGIDRNDPNSYFKFNPGQSLLPNYENDEQPFLIERGDEIRVSYASSSRFINQDFQVLEVTSSLYRNSSSPEITSQYDYLTNDSSAGGVDIKVFDKILVYPDPSTLISQIPSGSIYSYTVRKRQDADNIVNVYSPAPPSGSKGAQTYSGQGYIIPNDLTVTQKRNVQTLITQLKGKNNFQNDDTE